MARLKVDKAYIKNAHGNALWFILLVVALLGFLTSVISRSTSSVDQAGDVERASVKASSLLRYTKSIETTVQNMMLQGISVSDLDFGAIGAAYDNTNCSVNECDVFHVEGGGIPFRSASGVIGESTYAGNWHISTANRAYQFGCDTNTYRCTELLLLLSNIPRTLCLQINRIQNITNPGDDAPQINTLVEGDAFDGTFQSTGLNTYLIGGTDTANEAPQVMGKQAGCLYEFGADNVHHYYHILAVR